VSEGPQATAPTVYFIDDSATMREVIKIAFRRENIHVVACADATSALQQIEQHAPDVVITDVIMPEKDGYEVCQYIKQHPTLGKTPVILMSGVVNKSVAEKAFAVKADELIRKPFQPADLITRVKKLLSPGAPMPAAAPLPMVAASAALSSIFAAPPAAAARPTARPPMATPAPRPAISGVFGAAPAAAAPAPAPQAAPAPAPARVPAPPVRAAGGMDAAKMRLEIMRLENLVRKLEAELNAEREYSKALEEHIKTLSESD
jgi:CheY-like chemotaxis protein